MRTLLLIAAVVAAAAPSTATAQPAADPALKAYLNKMGVQMKAYRAALGRADHAFDAVPDRVAIDRFKARSAEFRRIAARIKPVRAPRGLAAQHRKIARAVEMVASAFGGFADARRQYLKDRNQTTVLRANTREHTRLRSAEKLEVAWARAVRARTVKAHLVVPVWLQDFFTG